MIYFTFLLFICLGFNLANADENDFNPTPQSSISFGGGFDSEENKDINIYLDLASSNDHHIGFSYFRNESSLENASSDNYSLSLATSSYETTSLDASFQYIKLADAMDSYIFNSTLNVNLENWHFSIMPQLNSMTFYLNSDKKNKFDIYAKGAELSVSYFGYKAYYVSANYFRNEFSEKPIFLLPGVFDSLVTNTINKIRIISRISELTSSLEQQHIAISAGRYFNWGSLDFSWSYAELFNLSRWLDFAALDAFKETNYITTYSANSEIIINEQFSLGLSVGRQTFSNDTNALFFTSSEINYNF